MPALCPRRRVSKDGGGRTQAAVRLENEQACIFLVHDGKRYALVAGMARYPARCVTGIGKGGERWHGHFRRPRAVKGHKPDHGGMKQCAFQEPVLRRA